MRHVVSTSLCFLGATILPACGSKELPHEARGDVVNARQELSGNRGVSGDKIADIQLGKRAFTEISAREIVPNKLNQPGGVVVDRNATWPGFAYVWDSGNNRILGINLQNCYATPAGQRCNPSLVIGQPSGSDWGACNRDASVSQYPLRPAASASTLCAVHERTHTTLEDKSFANMVLDDQSSLYVPDINNNRVLKYLNPRITNVVADEVWGQTNFTKNGCNASTDPDTFLEPTASTLCLASPFGSGGGVRIDPSGNLWVADGGNNRVVRFPRLGNGTISKTANLVLGQSELNTSGAGGESTQLSSPQALLFDGSWNLYVADTGNNRVQVFKKPLSGDFTTGMAAERSFGQFESGDCFGAVNSLQIDPDSQGIWTAQEEGCNATVKLWNYSGQLIKGPYAMGGGSGGAFDFDGQRNLLATTYGGGQDVFRLARSPDGSTYTEDKRFFSPPDGYNLTTSRRLEHPAFVGVAVSGTQLVATDSRLLFWNNVSGLTNAKDPSGYAGASSPTELPDPPFHQVKSAASKIWVAKFNEIQIFSTPLTTGQQREKALTSIPVLGGGTITFSQQDGVLGLAPTPSGSFLWVSLADSNRVIRIRNPLTAPIVDIILGQTSLNGTLCNRDEMLPPNQRLPDGSRPPPASKNMLCFPGSLSLDRLGNLYVSDHTIETQGNWRMLMFAPFPSNPSSVIYAPMATKEFPMFSQTWMPRTFEPAFNSANRMVVGTDPYTNDMEVIPNALPNTQRFVKYFLTPHSPTSFEPDGKLEDFYGWAVAMTFDAADNLYVYDANRGKISIYYKPL